MGNMTDQLVGAELRKARRAANYTQRALAELLGVTGSAVGQWETGATHPQWTQQQRLREILLPAEPVSLPVLDAAETILAGHVAAQVMVLIERLTVQVEVQAIRISELVVDTAELRAQIDQLQPLEKEALP